MSARPRIGISTSLTEGEQRLALDYVAAVEKAGGLPMPVPILAEPRASQAFAELLDGLIITGGPAIEEGLVGTLPEDIPSTDPRRTASDRFLLSYAREHRVPVLGICYGMQLANALAGGTIYADVEAQHGGSAVHSDKRGGGQHPVLIEPDSRLHKLLDMPEAIVNTRHIQAVAEVGKGYCVAARAPDGVIEAIEQEDGLFLGVQFHPERMGNAFAPLFRDLVEQAALRSSRRREHSAPVTA